MFTVIFKALGFISIVTTLFAIFGLLIGLAVASIVPNVCGWAACGLAASMLIVSFPVIDKIFDKL